MSSSIAIPKRRKQQAVSEAPSPSSSSSYSSSADSPRTSQATSATSSPQTRYNHDRRPSLLSSSISKCEHMVINVGHPDAPRLITCVKSSQGFDWNQDLFLPSYIDHDSYDLEHKKDPIQDIVLTDEEAASFLPQ
ncbi:hypothetical protein W97_04676 [Coniosporium apollinis CBS 100218]|uniref:Uncharacterized protein n=1 Tax=Coniosporium apollinis (strain CBS 100218) TaxID=1168221 RepID=R7YUA7_CONA1|nr:uncharacterized protein W97_04676 [Coniosporium apollinis CBS 100218]EON65438.1 hypothetical protein W97_04676 [Coniosporium apollinis CBS 100218]